MIHVLFRWKFNTDGVILFLERFYCTLPYIAKKKEKEILADEICTTKGERKVGRDIVRRGNGKCKKKSMARFRCWSVVMRKF